jgi:ABC-2 type transport system ATP-binding protein
LKKVAVDGVDLRIPIGQIFGLIGPNGAGKSTLVAMLATLMRPTDGEAWVMGHHVVGDARSVRLSLSLNASAGERGFYWRLNAFRNLEFFAAIQGLDRPTCRARVDMALEKVDLSLDSKLRFGEFSSGMKRRLNVARALLVDRSVYLFDEPTTGVDPHSAETIRRVLRELKSAGKTIVLVTHNMDEATELCGEVGMLCAGQLIRQDKPEAIRRLVAATEIEVQLIDMAAGEAVAERLRRQPMVEAVSVHTEGRLRVRTPSPEDDIRGLLRWAATAELPVAGVSVVRPELSDAFVRLVEEATGEIAPETGLEPPVPAALRRGRG